MRLVIVLLALCMLRCGAPTRPVDAGAGVEDAGITDAGITDAGIADAGVADAGITDAGITDAGITDAGIADAGIADAGIADAGIADAGIADAGIADAGIADAGIADAGVADAGIADAGIADAGIADAGRLDAGIADAGIADAGIADAGIADAGRADAGTPDGGSCTSIGPWAPHLIISLLDGGALPSPLFTRDPIDVRVVDLPPCRDVVLEFRLDAGFLSTARFTSDLAGVVSTARDAPVVGAWSGVQPNALFFSLSNQGVSGPTSHDLTVIGRWDGGAPFSTVVARQVLPSGVTITSFREATPDGLYADYARPPGAGPFPGVVVFGGSEGGLAGGVLTGSGLVRDGFAVLSIAYWGVNGKPSSMSRIPLETFQRAVQRLRSFPEVRQGKVAVLGVSRGGEGALLAGASFPNDIQAVVSLLGSGYAWAAPGSSTVSTWTLDGGDVPFVPWPTGSNQVVTRDGGITVSFGAPFFRDGVFSAADAGLLARAEVRSERINGPVLLVGAADDGVWPSCLLADVAWSRLLDAGHVASRGDVSRCFPDAGHSINPSRAGFPLVDLIDRGTGSTRTGYGGSAEADDAANRVLWELVRDFLTVALQ